MSRERRKPPLRVSRSRSIDLREERRHDKRQNF